jgi:hypothetical protein
MLLCSRLSVGNSSGHGSPVMRVQASRTETLCGGVPLAVRPTVCSARGVASGATMAGSGPGGASRVAGHACT